MRMKSLPIMVSLLISICIITFLTTISILAPLTRRDNFASSPTTLDHVVFIVASDSHSWPRQRPFVSLWWERRLRGCVFVGESDSGRDQNLTYQHRPSLPPMCVSGDTSHFPYTYKGGNQAAIRVARLVKEAVELNLPDVRWFVFGDDDTTFLPRNLAKTLSKYNHELWYYIGANSEVYEHNKVESFGTAFGGAGFAISSPLAIVLAKVIDSCLRRYQHLYGSDSRISSCLAELGVRLTGEPGFHQMDVRGGTFGVLAPLVSLHHPDHALPIFPNMTHLRALANLFTAVKADSEQVLQQTICYDHWFAWTISVSWGYAVQVFDHHMFLSDALRIQETFESNVSCRRAAIFFFDGVDAMEGGLSKSTYRRMVDENCTFDPMLSPKKLKQVIVISPKSNLGVEQLHSPRRQCCDAVTPSTGDRLEIGIRECKEDELTYMHP